MSFCGRYPYAYAEIASQIDGGHAGGGEFCDYALVSAEVKEYEGFGEYVMSDYATWNNS